MKRTTCLWAIIVLCCHVLMAQEGVVHDNILKLKIGAGYQLDTYLSPMGYTGLQYGLANEWWQPFRQDSKLGKEGKLTNWLHVGRADISIANYYSAHRTNKFLGAQIAAGWGACYEWKWLDDHLCVQAGPYLDAGFTIREHAKNVNKVVSFDVSIDVMAMGGIRWSFYGKHTSYRLNYLIRTNLIGFDFLPEYWESYYELSEGVPGQARCSGHWNHNTIKHELALDMQFKHSTWRVGAEHELVNYGTKDLHFMRNQFSFVIGCLWKYRIHANARL